MAATRHRREAVEEVFRAISVYDLSGGVCEVWVGNADCGYDEGEGCGC